MTIYYAFTHPRPALAPILFPTELAAMLDERYSALKLARRASRNLAHLVPAHLIDRQFAWSDRMSARIARVAK